jgi:hypothetical protein
MNQERKEQLLQNIDVLQQMDHPRLDEYLKVSFQIAELVERMEQLYSKTEHLEQQSLNVEAVRQRKSDEKQIRHLLQEYWFAFSRQVDARTALAYALRRAGYKPYLPPVCD